MKFNHILLLLGIIFQMHTFAVENNVFQEMHISFSKSELTVKEALDELSKLPGISVVYNGNEDFLKLRINVPVKEITVDRALELIQNQAPVDILFHKNHIIVKERKLKKSYLIKGVLKDKETSEVLVAATVFLAGTTRGTVTDNKGNFFLSLKPGNYKAQFRYIGYKDKSIELSLYQDQDTTIYLEPINQAIEEVKIIGAMAEVEDLEVGRPIEKIESKTVNQLNTNVVNDALQGRVNGVWTTKVSGAPGDHNKIRIRGISSIFGSTDPLYVVDGVIIPVVNFKTLGIADLNSHDVENIKILKDASSTVLYGNLGGNGVILIETKKGGGGTKFNFSAKTGCQWFPERYPLMNTKEFLTALDSSDSKLNTRFYFRDSAQGIDEKYPYYSDSLGNVIGYDDFQDEIFQSGIINEYQLSGQGSIKKLNYFISGNYYTHKGTVIGSEYDKYTFTGNISRNFFNALSLRFLYRGGIQENKNNLDNYLGNNVIYKGISYEPGYRYTPDSFLEESDRLNLNSSSYGQTLQHLSEHEYSPDKLFYQQQKERKDISNSFNFLGKYRITNALSINMASSVVFKNQVYQSYLPGAGDVSRQYLLSDERFVILNQQYDLQYNRTFGNHNISAFLRYRDYRDNVYWNVDSTLNVNLESLNSEDNIYLRGSQSIYGESSSVIRSIKSTIGNINYNYKEKFTLSFIANFEKLKEGFYVDKQDLFYSWAIDYDIAKEKFFHFPAWINALHIYANWGEAGNYPLNSLSNDRFSTSSEYTVSEEVRKAVFVGTLANHNLSREKVTESNFGSQMNLFNHRLQLSGDYFIKYNKDLLVERAIPNYYAGGYIFDNIGEMENRGIELKFELTPVDRPDLYWTTTFQYSKNQQKITKLYDSLGVSFNNTDIFYPDFYARENEALGTITGYKYEGVWDDSIHSAEVNGYNKYVRYSGMAFLNADTLTSLNPDDKTIIGYSIPKFTMSWINLIRYRNFSVEMMWYAVIGVDKYNATKAITYVTGTHSDVNKFIMDTLSFHARSLFYESSYFVEDASFIRLKTLSVRYHQPKKIMGRVGIEYTLSFENLVTITRYTGYDPEATIYTNNNFSDNAMDKGSYPNPRGVFFSIDLSF